eukprot:1159281-Pelagomonas_calceolata.AAC.4
MVVWVWHAGAGIVSWRSDATAAACCWAGAGCELGGCWAGCCWGAHERSKEVDASAAPPTPAAFA